MCTLQLSMWTLHLSMCMPQLSMCTLQLWVCTLQLCIRTLPGEHVHTYTSACAWVLHISMCTSQLSMRTLQLSIRTLQFLNFKTIAWVLGGPNLQSSLTVGHSIGVLNFEFDQSDCKCQSLSLNLPQKCGYHTCAIIINVQLSRSRSNLTRD